MWSATCPSLARRSLASRDCGSLQAAELRLVVAPGQVSADRSEQVLRAGASGVSTAARSATGSLPLTKVSGSDGARGAQAEILHLLLQHHAADAQGARGVGDVAVVRPQHVGDVLLLEGGARLLERAAEADAAAAGRRR